MKVVDELGLVPEGEYLTLFIPAKSEALVFRVKSRVNRRYEVMPYGSLPISAGASLPTYDGGSVTVPASGVMPARAYIKDGIAFPTTLNVYDQSDMWYLPEDYRERLFHVIQYVTPAFLRIDVQVPSGVDQGRFQKDRVVTGIDKDFGFARGCYEIVHIPKVRYGYRYGNDTNIAVRTFVKFVYAEYIIEIPKSSQLIFDILTKRIPSHWITLPINYMDPKVEDYFRDVYGVTGFPLYRIDQKNEAIRKYDELLRGVKV
jgi:hypothetical protein